MTTLTTLLRALADESRLRILSLLLSAGELCVCDLERVLGYTQTKVSRHLAYLRRTGLVVQRREGLWKLYSLAPARNDDHGRILKALRSIVRAHATVDDDLKKLAGRIGRVCCPTTGEVKQQVSPALLTNRHHRRRTAWMRTP